MKTINTKENQITLHTKDTIIEEDIVVNFEGGSGGGTDTSDATATSSDMLLGKTAYVKDEKITGTIPTWDGSVENGVEFGIKIPSVSNLNVNTYGVLTFDEPDYSKLTDYNPIISYLATVNGITVENSTNRFDIFNLLNEGENSITVMVKAKLEHKDEGITESIEYSIPSYTNVSDFTLETTTVDGVSGYRITAYNGSNNEINIPQYNTDGLPILELNSINASKINGKYIKKINSFSGNKNITEINFPNTTGNTSMSFYFNNCGNLEKVHNLNTSNCTTIQALFRQDFSDGGKLKQIPILDIGKVTTMYGFSLMFKSQKSLEHIPAIDFSNISIDYDDMFSGCTSLKSILMYGMQRNFNISASTKFEREDLVTILNNLGTVTSTRTLTMGTTNLEKLTEEDKAIATGKGWTLA